MEARLAPFGAALLGPIYNLESDLAGLPPVVRSETRSCMKWRAGLQLLLM
jgi:hypothetical protein